MSAFLTRVSLIFEAKRLNAWLRFGRPTAIRNVDAVLRHAYFAPGSVFAYVRWAANDYGTRDWTLTVLRACQPGERVQRIRGVNPGAESLLRVANEPKVLRALGLVDAIEAAHLRAEDVNPVYWGVAHDRLAANLEVRVYGSAEHGAFLQRAACL